MSIGKMKIIQIKYNQLGRRNLSDLDKAALLARKEPILKKNAKERMMAGVAVKDPVPNLAQGEKVAVVPNLAQPVNLPDRGESTWCSCAKFSTVGGARRRKGCWPHKIIIVLKQLW